MAYKEGELDFEEEGLESYRVWRLSLQGARAADEGKLSQGCEECKLRKYQICSGIIRDGRTNPYAFLMGGYGSLRSPGAVYQHLEEQKVVCAQMFGLNV